MQRKNSEIVTDINNTKAKLDELYKEREERIILLHTHGISINQIAEQLDMKRQNVSTVISKHISSLHI